MKKYFTLYRQYFRRCLEDDGCDLAALMEYHLRHIEFFMHERLIHLIVTVLFALLTIACFLVIVCTENITLIPLALLLLALLIPYIAHYYFLENQTQMLYRDYEELSRKMGSFSVDTGDDKP